MTLKLTGRCGNFTITAEGEDMGEAWDALAEASQCFTESVCGLCGKPNLYLVSRSTGADIYRELTCNDCGGNIQLTKSRETGNFFLRRKNYRTGEARGKNGWMPKWSKDDESESNTQAQAADAAPTQQESWEVPF